MKAGMSVPGARYIVHRRKHGTPELAQGGKASRDSEMRRHTETETETETKTETETETETHAPRNLRNAGRLRERDAEDGTWARRPPPPPPQLTQPSPLTRRRSRAHPPCAADVCARV